MLAALLAISASCSWGVSNFVAGLESRRRSVWTVTAVSQIASALSAALLLLFASGETLTVRNVVWAVIAGICGATGIVAFYRALALGAMSVVAPIIAAQVVVPVAVGLALGERPARRHGSVWSSPPAASRSSLAAVARARHGCRGRRCSSPS